MTWTVPEVSRPDPPLIAGEREALETWLDYHRLTLLSKCAGLTAEQLKEASAPPSNLTLLGLVRHMTDVERWWFRMHAGRQDLQGRYWTEGNEDGDFDDVAGADAAADLTAYEQEICECRAAVRGMSLDEKFPSRGDHPERVRDLRWIYVHMIEEYARHNGHADLLRERIDGVTGD
jgi:uncharacterized damage-inducible protein DinB